MKNLKWQVKRWTKTKIQSFRLLKIGFDRYGFSYLGYLLTFKCTSCNEHSKGIKTRRQNTSYADDIHNYTRECTNCHIEHESYWEERWAEYYGSIV